MLKIGFNGLFLSKIYTGIGQYSLNLLQSLLKQNEGHKFFIFLERKVYNSFMHLEDDNLVTLVPVSINYKNDILGSYFFEKKILQKIPSLGVNILYTPYPYAPPINKKRIKHFITVHDAIPSVYSAYRGSMFRKIYMWLNERGLHRADAIITVSNNSKKDIEKYYKIDIRKIHVLYESVDSNFVLTDKNNIADVRTRYNLPDKYIFYIGGFDFRKNVPLLMRAFTELKKNGLIEESLVIGGVFSPTKKQLKMGLTDNIPKLIEKLGMQKYIRLLGYIPPEDLPYIYRMATLSIYPSLYEGFGLPILEAMNLGVPVLASKTSSMPEIMTNEKMLFDPNDQSELSQKIIWLINDKPFRNFISNWEIERAKNFSWDEIARKTIQLFSEISKG